MAKIGKYGKIEFSESEKQYIKSNFEKMTNVQIAKNLGLKQTKVREYAYSLGLYKMRLEYWTPEQVEYLKANYKKQGDTEIAEYFTSIYQKDKGWSKKHIEKKRRYLKLKRTTTEKENIHTRNVELGRYALCSINAWITRGGASELGTIKVWKNKSTGYAVHVKTKQGYKYYSRVLWEYTNGTIPNGMMVRTKDGNPLNIVIENLELVTRQENAKRNSQNRYNNYPQEVKEAIKALHKLNRELKKHEK